MRSSHRTPVRETRDARYLIASQVIVLQSSLVQFVTPLYFGALTRERGFSATDLATVTSAEAAGSVTVVVLLSLFVSRLNLRRVGITAALLLNGATVACIGAGTVSSLLGFRLLVGIGVSVLNSVAYIYLAATRLPQRWFAWQMTLTTLITMAGLAVMPLVERRYGLAGFYVALVILGPATLWATSTLPARPLRQDTAEPADRSASSNDSSGWSNPRAWVAVAGLILYAAYIYPTYNFSDRIGSLMGLTPVAIGFVLSVTTPLGLVGSVAATALAGRIGDMPPIAGCVALVAVGAAALLLAPGSVGFWIGMSALSFVWCFAQPFLNSAVARADRDGRFLMLLNPSQDFGRVSMSFVFSAALDRNSMTAPALLGIVLMIGSLGCALFAERSRGSDAQSMPALG